MSINQPEHDGTAGQDSAESVKSDRKGKKTTSRKTERSRTPKKKSRGRSPEKKSKPKEKTEKGRAAEDKKEKNERPEPRHLKGMQSDAREPKVKDTPKDSPPLPVTRLIVRLPEVSND